MIQTPKEAAWRRDVARSEGDHETVARMTRLIASLNRRHALAAELHRVDAKITTDQQGAR